MNDSLKLNLENVTLLKVKELSEGRFALADQADRTLTNPLRKSEIEQMVSLASTVAALSQRLGKNDEHEIELLRGLKNDPLLRG